MKWSVIIFSTLFLSAPLFAQEESRESEGKEEKKEEAVKVVQTKAEEKTGENDADDYKPSEEVSEDLTVSYPVDI